MYLIIQVFPLSKHSLLKLDNPIVEYASSSLTMVLQLIWHWENKEAIVGLDTYRRRRTSCLRETNTLSHKFPYEEPQAGLNLNTCGNIIFWRPSLNLWLSRFRNITNIL